MRKEKKLVKLVITLSKLHATEVYVNTFFKLLLQLLQDEIAQFGVRLFQVAVVDDDIKVSRILAVLELDLCRV